MVIRYVKRFILAAFTIPIIVLMTACACSVGPYCTPDTIYGTTILSPPDTYTLTAGSPTSRSACSTCGNVYSSARMDPVMIPGPAIAPVYLNNPACGYSGCGFRPTYYGYNPICAWASSC